MIHIISKKKFIISFISVIIVAVSVSTWFIGSYFIDFALKRNDISGELPEASASIITQGLKAPGMPDYKNKEISITVDGERRIATAFYANNASNNWIIMVHGYCRDQRYVWNYADEYLQRGYNVLTPDLNASGKSAGQYLTMGAKESRDIQEWARYLVNKYADSRIVLHGVSMGAATVMLATSLELPVNVYAVIEDCGYTSAYDMFADKLATMFELPAFPILDMVSVVEKIKTGVSLSDASPINVIDKCKLSILFIHGDKDGLVPYPMMNKLYERCSSVHKDKMTVKNAAHASSIDVDKQQYFEKIMSFLAKTDRI